MANGEQIVLIVPKVSSAVVEAGWRHQPSRSMMTVLLFSSQLFVNDRRAQLSAPATRVRGRHLMVD